MTVQYKSHIFKSFDPISIFCFSKIFKLACVTNGVHNGAPPWPLHVFKIKTAFVVLTARVSAECTSQKKNDQWANDKIGDFDTYPQVVNFLLTKYATDESISETESKITRFAQPPVMTPYKYAENLVKRTLRFGVVYKQYALKEIFIEGSDASIRHSMR